MSIRNLEHASVRRYVEEEPFIKTARIYAEQRATWEQWEKDRNELITLWITEKDQQGNNRLDKHRPDLDPEPAYKIEYKTTGARIWLNICIGSKEEYNATLSEARAEAVYTLEQKARWKDYTSKSELTGTIDEVQPAAIRAITAKFNH